MESVCDLGCVETFFDTLAYFGEHVKYASSNSSHMTFEATNYVNTNRSIYNTRDSFYKYNLWGKTTSPNHSHHHSLPHFLSCFASSGLALCDRTALYARTN